MILFRRITFYLALLGLAGGAALVLRLRATEPVPPPPAPPPQNPYARSVAASGLIEAQGENTAVGVPVPGLIQEIHVRVWDRVTAGQPLLRLDDRDLRAGLLTLRANVGVAEASRRRVSDQLDRLRSVTDPRAVSREEVATKANELGLMEAQLEAARAAVAQAEALLERLTVRAPRAGTILQVNARAGEFATPGAARAPLVLGDTDHLQVRADIDEQLAPRVRPDMTAVGYLKGEATRRIDLEFVRIEPFIIPKVSLTGTSTERVDTRVLQVIYRFPRDAEHPAYVGQQMDLYLQEP